MHFLKTRLILEIFKDFSSIDMRHTFWTIIKEKLGASRKSIKTEVS